MSELERPWIASKLSEELTYPSLLSLWLRKWKADQQEVQKDHKCDGKNALYGLIRRGKLRLIDVHSGLLIVPAEPVTFIALSYVWGHSGHKTSRCIDTSTDGSRRSVDFARAPRTITDAASLVSKIGQRYLWVDAICINQEVHEDKSAVVSQMDAIYSCAYLTIVAADGTHADAGITRMAPSASSSETPVSFWHRGALTTMLPSRPALEDMIASTVWSTRGWTFQERLLSPRCVFFTRDEVAFTAYGAQEREAYSLRDLDQDEIHPIHIDSLLSPHDSLFQLHGRNRNLTSDTRPYCRAVEAFTAKSLTRPDDRSSAIQGVSNAFVRMSDSYKGHDAESLIGIHPDIPWHCLLWQPLSDAKRIGSGPGSARPPPSWSWCGWTGPVSFPDHPNSHWDGTLRHDKHNIYLCDCLSKRGQVDDNLPTILHLDTYLLTGKLVEMTPENDDQSPFLRRCFVRMATSTTASPDVSKQDDSKEETRPRPRFITDDPATFDSMYSGHAHFIDVPLSYDPAPSDTHTFVYVEDPKQVSKWVGDYDDPTELRESSLMLVKARADQTDMFERVAMSELHFAIHPGTYAHNIKRHIMLV